MSKRCVCGNLGEVDGTTILTNITSEGQIIKEEMYELHCSNPKCLNLKYGYIRVMNNAP